MPHPDSHNGPPISSKNAAKRALNLRGEEIAFFHIPTESLSSQEAEFLDQARKEVPTWKMGRIVAAIDQ
jgi:hypothetical protein